MINYYAISIFIIIETFSDDFSDEKDAALLTETIKYLYCFN